MKNQRARYNLYWSIKDLTRQMNRYYRQKEMYIAQFDEEMWQQNVDGYHRMIAEKEAELERMGGYEPAS